MILFLLIFFLIRTVFQVFEANNKVISLFALVPLDEIQNLQRNCEEYKKQYVESKEIVLLNESEENSPRNNNYNGHGGGGQGKKQQQAKFDEFNNEDFQQGGERSLDVKRPFGLSNNNTQRQTDRPLLG